MAVERGDLDVVQRLLPEVGVNSKLNSRSHTALHVAARCGHLHVVEFLVARGADFNSTNLNTAAFNNRLHVVDFLLVVGCAHDE